jgi:hypothetical protein
MRAVVAVRSVVVAPAQAQPDAELRDDPDPHARPSRGGVGIAGARVDFDARLLAAVANWGMMAVLFVGVVIEITPDVICAASENGATRAVITTRSAHAVPGKRAQWSATAR